MENNEKQFQKKQRYNDLLFHLTEMIKRDIYENTVVATIIAWFETNETILELDKKIAQNVETRWEFLKYKIEARLNDFGNSSGNLIDGENISQRTIALDVSKPMSEIISNVVGVLGASFVGMISGGSGVALISSGLFGWIIGAVIGAIIFFHNADDIKKSMETYIVNKNIPPFLKKLARNKILSELKLNESRFEKEVFEMLKKHLDPVFNR